MLTWLVTLQATLAVLNYPTRTLISIVFLREIFFLHDLARQLESHFSTVGSMDSAFMRDT